MQRIRSALLTVEIRWLIKSTVIFFALWDKPSSTFASVEASSALVQSSRISIDGFFSRALAMDSLSR